MSDHSLFLTWLATAAQQQASDIHLATGLPPQYRIAGTLTPLDHSPLATDTMTSILKQLFTDNQQTQLTQQGGLDCVWLDPASQRRYRVYGFLQRYGISISLRCLPQAIPDFKQLKLPDFWSLLTPPWHGLIIVTGPTGSGKTQTLAALINELLRQHALHVVTLEDPIEMCLSCAQGLIQQCELGTHFAEFAITLKGILRADPDIIVVGEIRDQATMRLVLTAAQTGHLVLATLHTKTADQAITRILHSFDEQEQNLVRESLAQTLRLIIAQRLLNTNNKQRLAAVETITGTPAVRQSIRTGKLAQIYSLMQTGQQQGMWTFEQYLRQLTTDGDISPATIDTSGYRN
jgi:twitching motility protein PilT